MRSSFKQSGTGSPSGFPESALSGVNDSDESKHEEEAEGDDEEGCSPSRHVAPVRSQPADRRSVQSINLREAYKQQVNEKITLNRGVFSSRGSDVLSNAEVVLMPLLVPQQPAAPTKTHKSKARRLVRLDVGYKDKRSREELKRSSWATWKKMWERRHAFLSINKEQRNNIQIAFDQNDRDKDGLLTLNQVRLFVRDLGLGGASEPERREESRLCRLAALGEGATQHDFGISGVDFLERRLRMVNHQSNEKQEEVGIEAGMVTLYDVALWILPRLRRVLEDLCFEDLQMRWFNRVMDPWLPLALDVCTSLGMDFGVAPQIFRPLAEQVLQDYLDEGDRAGRRNSLEPREAYKEKEPPPTTPLKSVAFVSTQSERSSSPPVALSKSVAPSAPLEPTPTAAAAVAAAAAVPSGPVLDASLVAVAITASKEKVSFSLSLRQRKVQAQTQLLEKEFQATRSHLLPYFDRYESFRQLDRDFITVQQVWAMLKELGVVPLCPANRKAFDRDLWATGEVNRQFMNFAAVLRFVHGQRQGLIVERSEELAKCFRLFERERVGSLSLSEASQALEYFNLVPKTREEQDAVRALYVEADPDGSGRIQRDRFRMLWIRVQEELQVLEYETGLLAALHQGLSELECRKLWQVYGEEDQDEKEMIKSIGLIRATPAPAAEKRSSLRWSSEASACGEEAGDGATNAGPHVWPKTFAAFVRQWCPPPKREGGPGGGEDGPGRLYIVVRTWTRWDLRRALNFSGLPKDYVQSLSSYSELAAAVALHFGVNPKAHHDHMEEMLVAVAEQIGARSAADLFRASLARKEEVWPDPWEKKVNRERITDSFATHFGLLLG